MNLHTFAMAPERGVVHSQNNFLVVPHYDFANAPHLDRVLLPTGPDGAAKQQVIAAWSADASHRPVENIFQNVPARETAYDATFEDLARTQGATFGRSAASLWFYVMDPNRLQGSDWTLPDVLTPLLISLLGASLVYGATHLKLSRRARLQQVPQRA
jgi:hypothetical protein